MRRERVGCGEKLRPDYEGIETPAIWKGFIVLNGEKLRPDYEGIETDTKGG